MKRIHDASGLLLVAVAAFAAGRLVTGAETVKSAEEPAEKKFKNIKVFTGLPASELDSAMDYMASSLGVSCGFCHVSADKGPWPFDKDDKEEKKTARKMIEMVREINKTHFEGKKVVSCATCHNGSNDPAQIPPFFRSMPARFETFDREATPEPGLPASAKLIEKHQQACGGLAAAAQFTSRESKGVSVNAQGKEFPVEIVQKAGGKYFRAATTQNGEIVRGFDGKTGWMKRRTEVREISGGESEEMKAEAAMDSQLDLAARFKEMLPVASLRVEGRSLVLVRARTVSGRPAQLYFDADSGILARTIEYEQTPLGDIAQQTDYDDWKEADGIKLPFTVRTTDSRHKETLKFSSIRHNVPVEDSRFDRPK